MVLHETDIRKQKGDFAFLSHRPKHDEFVAWLSDFMEKSNFILIACVVDKARLSRGVGESSNPYHIALVLLCHKISFSRKLPQQGHCPRRAISA